MTTPVVDPRLIPFLGAITHMLVADVIREIEERAPEQVRCAKETEADAA